MLKIESENIHEEASTPAIFISPVLYRQYTIKYSNKGIRIGNLCQIGTRCSVAITDMYFGLEG